jgi:putative tryptophan/tyrosine transport system substrate-binding protein
MRRREFIAGLGGAAAWALAARAQQPPVPVIGYLGNGTLETAAFFVRALKRGLSEAGYVEGRDLGIEYRWAEYRLERLPALAADLVRHRVALIVAGATPGALASKAATNSIPIVFQIAADPVATGLVASLSQPGGNATGIYNLTVDLAAKRLELLHEVLPAATSIAFLTNPTDSAFAEPEARELQAAARILGLRLLVLNASDKSEFEGAFAALAQERVGALLISGEAVFSNNRDPLVALASRYRVPAMHPNREHAEAGGLMSYTTDFSDVFRQVGLYAGRILKGEKPANLPVQQATKVELVINMKTAKALGITFPTALLVRADEVIE